jgi:mannosyltransferase
VISTEANESHRVGAPTDAGPVAPAAPERTLARDLVLPELALPVAEIVHVPRAVPRPWRWVAWLTGFALVIRVALIGVQSLWLDETLSLQQAQMPLVDMWRFQLTENVHVPLYHTLLHFWLDVAGTSAVSLRLFSVVFGTACIPLLFLVMRRLFDERVAVIAAAIGAAAPFWIWHADEARMYPLMLAAGLASFALLFRAVDRGGFWRWAAYAAVTALGFYSHYFLLLMPPVHLLWLLAQRVDRRKLLAWFAATAAAGAVLVPWIVLLATHRLGAGATEFTNHGQDYLHGSNPFAVGYAVITFVSVFVVGYHSVPILEVVSAVLVGSWPLLAVARSIRRTGPTDPVRRRNALFLGGWLASLVLGVYLIDLVKPGVWYQKYLVMASVPAIGLLALAVDRIGRRLLPLVVVVVIALSGVAIAQNVEGDNPVRQDWAGAADLVAAGYQPGDVVAVLPAFNSNALGYYWHDRGPIWGLLRHSYEVDDTITVDLREIHDGHAGSSLWVVTSHAESFDPTGKVTSYLRDNFPLLASDEVPAGLIVTRYRIPAGPLPPPPTDR